MSLVYMPAEGDLPPLTIRHGWLCTPSAHRFRPNMVCRWESGIENDVERYLLSSFPDMTVLRQPAWGSVGRPDLVTLRRVSNVMAVTILELKRTIVNESALVQLGRYVLAATREARDSDIPTMVTGVLVGFRFRPLDLPEWATRWPLRLEA